MSKRVVKEDPKAASVILDENELDGEEKPSVVKKSGEKVLKTVVKVKKTGRVDKDNQVVSKKDADELKRAPSAEKITKDDESSVIPPKIVPATVRSQKHVNAEKLVKKGEEESIVPLVKAVEEPKVGHLSKDLVGAEAEPLTKDSEEPVSDPLTKDAEEPSPKPLTKDAEEPSSKPLTKDAEEPSSKPLTKDAEEPSSKPLTKDAEEPSSKPLTKDAEEPSSKPLTKDAEEPSSKPLTNDSEEPSSKPLTKVAEEPSSKPLTKDSNSKRNLKDHLKASSLTKKAVSSPEKTKRSPIDSESEANLCDSGSKFNYYVAYPAIPSKYVVCDPWGTYEVRECPTDLVWDTLAYTCTPKESLTKIDFVFASAKSAFNVSQAVKCGSTELQCVNGGSCLQLNDEQRCLCTPAFTGEFCESDVNTFDLFHQILFGNFSIEEYKAKIVEENVTTDISYYEKYKSKLDVITYEALINYLSLYKKNDIRYDTLLTALLEDVLDNMYPDAKYLSTFNASSHSVVDVIRMVPNLVSYAKYTSSKYEKIFAEFEKVLTRLAQSLNTTGDTAKFRLEATKYQQLTYLFLNKTIQSRDSQGITIRFSDVEVRGNIGTQANVTLDSASKLFAMFEKFQASAQKESKLNVDVLNVTLGESSIKESDEVVRLLNEIAVSGTQMWDSLVNYGFWYLTNLFAEKKST